MDRRRQGGREIGRERKQLGGGGVKRVSKYKVVKIKRCVICNNTTGAKTTHTKKKQ